MVWFQGHRTFMFFLERGFSVFGKIHVLAVPSDNLCCPPSIVVACTILRHFVGCFSMEVYQGILRCRIPYDKLPAVTRVGVCSTNGNS